jgi:hypothetical protein
MRKLYIVMSDISRKCSSPCFLVKHLRDVLLLGLEFDFR